MSVLRQGEREGAIVPHRAVDKEHSDDESHGTAGADGRKVGDGVAAVVLQDGERCSVRQCKCRHVEGHAEGVDGYEEGLVADGIAETCRHTHVPQHYHECSGYEMADAEESLRLYPFVGDDADECRHKY